MAELRRLAIALAVSAALVVGLWVRPSLAAPAPFCDERAATALAPPPAPTAADQVIARAACHANPLATLTSRFLGLAPGHPAPDTSPSVIDAAVPTAVPKLARPPSVPVDGRVVVDAPARGVRSRIERPPRA